MGEVNAKLKGSVVTTIVLEVLGNNDQQLIAEVRDKVATAPNFFLKAPLVIHFSDQADVVPSRLADLTQAMTDIGFAVIGWRLATPREFDWLGRCSLPLLTTSKRDNEKELQIASSKPEVATVQEVCVPATIIDRPIRSGQQIYAKGDLIVMSSVSAGAEVLAEGNIHVYGALRGRALAGVSGNEKARIICQNLEAELVAIAGTFSLSDQLAESAWRCAVQIQLVDDKINVVTL